MAELGEILQSFRNRRPYRLRVILLCTMAATTFWFLNALNKEHTATLNYPLQFMYDPQNYVELDRLPDNVSINVNGIGWNLLKNSMGIKITPLLIPLQNPADQKKIAASTLPSLISEQLSDFQLNYVLTDTLYINLDRRARKVFHLGVDSLQIPLAELHRLNSPISISPDSIVIQGPESLLNNLQDTIFLDLGDRPIDTDYAEQVNIPISNQRLQLGIEETEVIFGVETLVEKSVKVNIDRVGFSDSTLKVFPDEIRLYYTVSEDLENEFTSENFHVIVDYSTLGEDSTLLPIIDSMPVEIRSVRSDSVKIQVIK